MVCHGTDTLAYTSGAWTFAHAKKVVADGDDYVVVEVTGLNGLYTTYSVTIENTDGTTKVDRALSDYGVTGTNDKALELKFTIPALPTNVVSGYTYDLSGIKVQAKSAGGTANPFTEAYGYKVTIGELGSVILTQTDTDVALSGTLTVTKNIDITKANITVEVVDGMDVVSSTWDDHTVTLTFNYEVDNTTGTTTSNYEWNANGKGNNATLATAVVSGKTVTLTFTGDPLLAGNKITVKNVADKNDTTNNKIDGTTGIDVVLG